MYIFRISFSVLIVLFLQSIWTRTFYCYFFCIFACRFWQPLRDFSDLQSQYTRRVYIRILPHWSTSHSLTYERRADTLVNGGRNAVPCITRPRVYGRWVVDRKKETLPVVCWRVSHSVRQFPVITCCGHTDCDYGIFLIGCVYFGAKQNYKKSPYFMKTIVKTPLKCLRSGLYIHGTHLCVST